MPAKVKLQVVSGPMRGKVFSFEEHDVFLFGRMPDCSVCLPGDRTVSRYHFILETNPPAARVRDLGSRNGTYVNGVKQGGRQPHETPEQGAKRSYPEVDLKHGDRLQVGATALTVAVEADPICAGCGRLIPDHDMNKPLQSHSRALCPRCREIAPTQPRTARLAEPLRCVSCGGDMSEDDAKDPQNPGVCAACRRGIEANPKELMARARSESGEEPSSDQPPPLDDYEFKHCLGTGAFGAVHLARHRRNDLQVAVKVMLARRAVDDNSRKRFLQEIKILQGLRHPNIVSLLDYGSEGGAFYFIMEYCEGGSVRTLLKQRGGTLPLPEASTIILAALNGLASAHQKNFVHRDIKPDNILLAAKNDPHSAKLADFGLAKNFEQAGFSGVTVTGSAGGTPFFMPREQVTNFKYVKPASDVWSMAATFYFMLTGQYPRNIEKDQDPLCAILENPIVPIRERDPKLPAKLAEVIDRALANAVKERYQEAAEMRKALQLALQP